MPSVKGTFEDNCTTADGTVAKDTPRQDNETLCELLCGFRGSIFDKARTWHNPCKTLFVFVSLLADVLLSPRDGYVSRNWCLFRAFSRMVARRGWAQKMLSDNGTDFVGADNELRVLV